MFNLNETNFAGNRALISINKKKTDIDRNLKPGMINYVNVSPTGTHVDELYLTTPASKPTGNYIKILTADESGKISGTSRFESVEIEKDLLVNGNLTVLKEITSVHSNDLTVDNNMIYLNKDGIDKSGTGIALGVSGLVISRGDEITKDAYLRFNESLPFDGATKKGFELLCGDGTTQQQLLAISTDKTVFAENASFHNLSLSEDLTANKLIVNSDINYKGHDVAYKDHNHYVSQAIEPTKNLYNGLFWYSTKDEELLVRANNDFKRIPIGKRMASIEFSYQSDTLTSESSKAIVPGYDFEKDELLVYIENNLYLDPENMSIKGGKFTDPPSTPSKKEVLKVYLQKNIDYTLDGTDNSINKMSGTWPKGTKFNYVILRYAKTFDSPVPDPPMVKRTAVAFDNKGNITKNEYRLLRDNKLYKTVEASNPDSKNNYQTVSEKFYDVMGTSVVKTIIYTLQYDSRGKIIANDGGIVA